VIKAQKTVKKLPILLVYIKEINLSTSGSHITLTDYEEEIRGTISKSILNEHKDLIRIGSVLLIQEVIIYSTYYFLFLFD
jgi:hypothetical protein